MIYRVFLFLMFCATLLSADSKSEISALLQNQDDAWNRGDLDGFLEAYDTSGRLVFIGSSGVIRDRQVLKQKYEKKYKIGGTDYGNLSFSDLQVEELGKGLARAWGRWKVQQGDSKANGWFTLILRKSEGQWRIIHDHSS